MIKRWEIRENTITDNSIYLLLIEGDEESAARISGQLSAFCRLIEEKVPPFSYAFELYNITDDSMLEKIRIKIEEISQQAAIEGDINERTKHVNLDAISPATEILGRRAEPERETRAVQAGEKSFRASKGSFLDIEPVKETTKVSAEDIFGSEKKEEGKVHLSDGDFSIKQDFANIESLDIELDASSKGGDGTFINLSSAESTHIKNHDMGERTLPPEDKPKTVTMGIATLIGGKYPEKKEASIRQPVLKLMGEPADDPRGKEKLVEDPYKKEISAAAKEPQKIQPEQEQKPKNQYMPSVDNTQEPAERAEKKKSGGFWGKLLGKFKAASADNLKKQDSAQAVKETKSAPPAEAAKEQGQSVEKERANIPAEAKEEPYNPFANLGEKKTPKPAAAPAREQRPSPKAAVSRSEFHSIGPEGKAAVPIEEIMAPVSNEDFSPKLQVDDIFAAETICEFYADPEETGGQNKVADMIPSQSAPSSAGDTQSARQTDAAKQAPVGKPLGDFDDLLDIPTNLLSSKKETAPKSGARLEEENPPLKSGGDKNTAKKEEPARGVSFKADEAKPADGTGLKENGQSAPAPDRRLPPRGEEENGAQNLSNPMGKEHNPLEDGAEKTAEPEKEIPISSIGGNEGADRGESDGDKGEEFAPGEDNAENGLIDLKEKAEQPRESVSDLSEKEATSVNAAASLEYGGTEPEKTENDSYGGSESAVVPQDMPEGKPSVENSETPASSKDVPVREEIAPATLSERKAAPKAAPLAKGVKPPVPPAPSGGKTEKPPLAPGKTISAAKPPVPPKRPDIKEKENPIKEKTEKGEMKTDMTQDVNNKDNRPSKPIMPGNNIPSAPKAPSAPIPPAPRSNPVPPRPRPTPPASATPRPAGPQSFQKPAQKSPAPRAATAVDHTILVSAGQVYKRNNWPLEIPLNPLFTFDKMDMASNRFAHATAMSVIDNIGVMHNPFMVYGESGTGKTHFLNAMGYELAMRIGQEKIFFTNGVRFSRGVQRYVEEGNIKHLEDFFSSVEVLIIDDIHLTAVNEHNREFISIVLNRFLQDRKQILISSKYPPESLARFEELVRFRLDQGWVSELKAPRQQHFSKIYGNMIEAAELGLTEEQAKGFISFDKANLGAIARNIKRAKVLGRRINNSGLIQMSYANILNEMLAVNGENEKSEIALKDFSDITSIKRSENTDWGNFGFFYPQDQSDKFKWIAFCVMQKAKELGIKGGFNFALKSSYSTDHIISSAFKIANICDNKNLKGAIILGPSLSVCQESIRDNFYDILTHMLEVMMIRCGIIDAENIKTPSAYVRVLGDVLK